MIHLRLRSVNRAVNRVLESAAREGIWLSWDRLEEAQPQDGFGRLGLYCPSLCLQGPCRIDPFGRGPARGVCGRDGDEMAAAWLLRAMGAGAAVLLRGVDESPAPLDQVRAEIARILAETAGPSGAWRRDSGKVSGEGLLQDFCRAAGVGYQAARVAAAYQESVLGTPAPFRTTAGLGSLDPDAANILIAGGSPRLARDLRNAALEIGGEGVQGYRPDSSSVPVKLIDSSGLLPLGVPFGPPMGAQELTFEAGLVQAVVTEDDGAAGTLEVIDRAVKRARRKSFFKGSLDAPRASVVPLRGIERVADLIFSALAEGRIRGLCLLAGDTNARQTQGEGFCTLAREMLGNGILCLAAGDAATALAAEGFMDPGRFADLGEPHLAEAAADLCSLEGWDGDPPPVLHLGTIADASRYLDLLSSLSSRLGTSVSSLPAVTALPEAASPVSISVAGWLVASGVTTYLGAILPIWGSRRLSQLVSSEVAAASGGRMITDPGPADHRKAAGKLLERIDGARGALGLASGHGHAARVG